MYELAYGAIRWSLVDSAVGTQLKTSIPPLLESVKGHEFSNKEQGPTEQPYPSLVSLIDGSVVQYGPSADNYSCCELMVEMVTLSPENGVLQTFTLFFHLSYFLPPVPQYNKV